jgi:hypothetical protein
MSHESEMEKSFDAPKSKLLREKDINSVVTDWCEKVRLKFETDAVRRLKLQGSVGLNAPNQTESVQDHS